MKPTAYVVTHPVSGAVMVFAHKERAIERASSMRTFVTPLFAPAVIASYVERLDAKGNAAHIVQSLREL